MKNGAGRTAKNEGAAKRRPERDAEGRARAGHKHLSANGGGYIIIYTHAYV